jgi:predicted phosphodiesterase
MTRLGVISDLHSDLPMLQAALERLDALGCAHVVCAGDVVDGEVFPDECIALLKSADVATIRGNHDRWALEQAGLKRQGVAPETILDMGGGQELSKDSLRWLGNLPASLDMVVEGVRVAVRHARPSSMRVDDMTGIDPKFTSPKQLATMLELANDADVLLVGHTHEHFAEFVPREGRDLGIVANPGALWGGGPHFGPVQPDPKGTFGVLELPALRFVVRRAMDGAVVRDSAGRRR